MFPVKKTKIDTEWAVVQVKTSVDYGHGNALVTFLTGALNYQIEHHLFPSIAQVHYPAIAPIVMATCKEFDVPYNNLPTFVDAFWCHLKHLYQMGSKASMS
jgi:fatty acid desaturase